MLIVLFIHEPVTRANDKDVDNCRLLAKFDFHKFENKIKQKEILTKIECAGAIGDNGQASNQVGRDCGGQLSFIPFLKRGVDQVTSSAKASFHDCESKSLSCF